MAADVVVADEAAVLSADEAVVVALADDAEPALVAVTVAMELLVSEAKGPDGPGQPSPGKIMS